MKARVSIVIPIYNVEKYLERCIESVLIQTENNLEIILVDDGSPDKCPYICDEYAKKDDRIRVIHKKNGGLASARNAGMSIAQGKYLFFLDSDDWLEPDGIQILYDVAEKYQVDFVRYRAFRTGWPGLPYNAPCVLEAARELQGGYYDKKRIIREVYPRLLVTSSLTMGAIVGAWGSLYNMEFLRKNQLHFFESIKYSEDIIFSAMVVKQAEHFYYIDKPGVYHYFYNPASISKSFKKDRWDSCKKMITISEKTFADEDYSLKNQNNLLRWFCILLSLNERKHLTGYKDRYMYCREILWDPICIRTPLVFKNIRVDWKQRLMMLMVKLRMTALIAFWR